MSCVVDILVLFDRELKKGADDVQGLKEDGGDCVASQWGYQMRDPLVLYLVPYDLVDVQEGVQLDLCGSLRLIHLCLPLVVDAPPLTHINCD